LPSSAKYQLANFPDESLQVNVSQLAKPFQYLTFWLLSRKKMNDPYNQGL